MPSLWDSLFGQEGKSVSVPTMTPEQRKLFGDYLAKLGIPMEEGFKYLNSILSGSPEALEAYQAPYLRQFSEQTVPQLAEQFAGYSGGHGGLSSSAFGQALGGAGASLQENLAAQKANLQSGAFSDLSNMLNLGFNTHPYQRMQTQGNPGFLGNIASVAGQGIGSGFSGGVSDLIRRLFGGR